MMKKLSKSAAKKLAEARIQRAITGYRIPMMTIPALYRALEKTVAGGGSDLDLRMVVDTYPGVEAPQ